MNVALETRLSMSGLNEKDCYEMRQIFQFVNEEKKMNIIENFDTIVSLINAMQSEMRFEQEVLLGKTIHNIEVAVKAYQTTGISQSTVTDIQDLKTKL